jgi:hypothetical protein
MPALRNVFALGPVRYSVTVMGIWMTAESGTRIGLFHLVVNGIGTEDAEAVAKRAVHEHLTESGALDGLKELTVAATIPGRHPNLTDGVLPVTGEDDGTETEGGEEGEDAHDEV